MPDSVAMPVAAADIAEWYELDAEGRVTAVCPAWDAVASRAGAHAGTLQGSVIGQPLMRFISGDATRMYMDAALQAVRVTGQPRTLRYRCDTPVVRRSMEMTLRPRAGGAVRIEHRLIDQQTRVRGLTCCTDDAPGTRATGAEIMRCSVCLRLQRASLPWEEPEQVASPWLVVRYTVCARCQIR